MLGKNSKELLGFSRIAKILEQPLKLPKVLFKKEIFLRILIHLKELQSIIENFKVAISMKNLSRILSTEKQA